jgi:hypothetical protein
MKRSFTLSKGRSRAIVAGICIFIFSAAISAQVTSVKLPKADSSASFQVKDSGSVVKMRLNGDGSLYNGGTFGTGTIPAQGAGTRLMWHPAKAAFRAGYVDGTQWDESNAGAYSIAMGYGTIASGLVSTAMGINTTASGQYSTALGCGTTASGQSSIAMGNLTTASGNYSTAMGYGDTARGNYSTATGFFSTASGLYSTAMGYRTTASGNYSTAMGTCVSTAGYEGSFVIGDNSTTTTKVSTAINQMTMRFAGGYRLFTNSSASWGAYLGAEENSWSALSDSTKKANFVKADHDYFLSSLSKLRLGSWNYKSQDAKNYRHYGPMAQEIYHFFGHDGKGAIGCDTLLASADMDGIMMICLQALEKRTGELQKANEKIAEHETRMHILEAKIEQLSRLVSASSTSNSKQLSLNISKE